MAAVFFFLAVFFAAPVGRFNVTGRRETAFFGAAFLRMVFLFDASVFLLKTFRSALVRGAAFFALAGGAGDFFAMLRGGFASSFAGAFASGFTGAFASAFAGGFAGGFAGTFARGAAGGFAGGFFPFAGGAGGRAAFFVSFFFGSGAGFAKRAAFAFEAEDVESTVRREVLAVVGGVERFLGPPSRPARPSREPARVSLSSGSPSSARLYPLMLLPGAAG